MINFVLKTRNCVLKMMNFAETPRGRGHADTERGQNLASLRSRGSDRALLGGNFSTSGGGGLHNASPSVAVSGRREMNGEPDGALPSSDPNEIYYVGVIDLLVGYGKKKKLEAQVSKNHELFMKTRDCVLKTRNSVVKTRNSVVKTRNSVVKMMNCSDPRAVGECHAWYGLTIGHRSQEVILLI